MALGVWLLGKAFSVRRLTTNGLVGTQMIAFCGDHGIPPVAAAGCLAVRHPGRRGVPIAKEQESFG
jgi:hypothetical protein